MEETSAPPSNNSADKSISHAVEFENSPTNTQNHHTSLDHTETNIDVVQITQGSPYLEPNFIGTYIGVCLSCGAGYAGFVLPATSLELINLDIGPSANIYWVALAWTLSMSVGYTLVGRLSDIFGRRWFFIGTSILALVGCIIGATAPGVNGVNQLIGANVFIGIASAGQLSFNYMIGELVPVKHRGFAIAGIYLVAVPFSGFGPVIARLFIVHTAKGWRWDYYLSIILNGICVTLFTVFYHPPVFDDLHRRRTKLQELKDLDHVGILLFIAGLVLFLMGLSWGGSAYPWKSAHVITTIVVGFVICVVFVLYECYRPLRRPLIPMHLLKNPDFTVLTVVTSVGGMLYFSLSLVYPTMVAILFTQDIVYQGLLICAIGASLGLGQILGAFFATFGGFIKWKLFSACICATAFTAGLAGVTTDKNTTTALLVFASIAIGILESLAVTVVTIVIEDQTELGAGAGTFGSIRSMAGVVATTISTTVLTNKVTSNTESIVVPALIKAGLPLTSLKPFLTALGSGNVPALLAVPQVTPQIIAIGTTALKTAYSKAFTVVYLVSIAFGALAVIASWWTPNVEDRRHKHDVVRRLKGAKGEVDVKDMEAKLNLESEKQ